MNSTYEPFAVKNFDIAADLKATTYGKACGVDGLAAKHFIYEDESILSILFSSFFTHVFCRIHL